MALAASFCMLCAASMSAMTMLTAFASGFARLFRIKFMRCPFLMRSAPPGGGNCPLPLRIHRAKPSGAVSFRLMLRACFCSCHNALFFLRAREPASDGAESSHISNMLRFLRSVLQGFQALVTDREQALKKHDPACSDRK